jgi:hypothetical protein
MKKEIKKGVLSIAFFLFSILLTSFILAEYNVSTEVGANILGFHSNATVYDVSIEVPDSINFGDVTKDSPVSDEIKIYINNTGRLPVTVTPQLFDSEETIFSYLFFRTTKTSNGTEVPLTRIGDYSLDIDKPASGSPYRAKYCYISLDLTDFTGDTKEDLIGYKSKIVFLAMPQQNE